MRLRETQVDEYRRRGFTLVADFVSPERMRALREEADRIVSASEAARLDPTRVEMEPDRAASGRQIRRIYEPCEHYAPFRDHARSAEVLDAVEQLIGPDLLLHYSKLNMKPAEVGSVVEWHQDLSYYPLTNGDSLALLLYLDDAGEENGCLQVLPGRHEAELLDHSRAGVFQGCITERIDTGAAVSLPGKAGTALFLHGMTPHASARNRSGQRRRALIVSYRAADAFPIHIDERTAATEAYTRLVRGTPARQARFTFRRFPVPVYGAKEASLYELQERSRKTGSVAQEV